MKRKIISFFMVLVLIITIIPIGSVSVFAQTEYTEPTILVESKRAAAGTDVEVNLNLVNNPGLAGAKITISYNSKLTLTGASNGETCEALDYTNPGVFQSPCNFNWDSESAVITNDGTMLKLTFHVSDTAIPNEQLDINVTYRYGDIYNGDLDSLNFQVVNGCLTIIDYVPGDVNGDKLVNGKDITLMRRYNAAGYDVSINEAAADVNEDGVINGKDITLIRRYIAGGYGVELKPSKPKCVHSMQLTPYKAATCTEDGNSAYWYCSNCEKYFNDKDGTTEIAFENITIKATGHTAEIDQAVAPTYTKTGLTEGSHCSVCHTVIKAQEEIPMLQKTEYSITYHVSNGDEYLAKQNIDNSNPSVYTEEDGISKFSNPSVSGYQFLGWYDLPSGDAAENIKSIPAGTTGNIDLYAKWEKIPYKVNFSSDLIPVESETYTVDEEHVLPSPKLDGYIFVGWSDAVGNVIKNIPAGTVGVKTYTANWLSERNQAWANNTIGDPIVYEDDDTNTILFAYSIGEIRNVPVSVIHDFGKINSNGITKTVTTEVSKSVSKSCMDTYTNTVQKATTDSFSWTLSSEWSDSVSVNEEWAKEQGITEEEVNTKYRDDNSNWYVSNGSSGSSSISAVSGTDTTTLKSSTKSKTTTDSDTSTDKAEVSAELKATYGNDVTGKIEAGVSASVSSENTHIDSTVKDKSDSNGTNKTEYGKTTTDSSASWNSEAGYGGSSTTGESTAVSKALSQKLSEQYSIGKTYINTDSESSTQGKSTSAASTNEYSSAVTYSTVTNEKRTETYTTENTVSGYHRWVMAGTAHVFAVVGYDIASESYFVNTFTIMDDEIYEYEDYSYLKASYDDNENSVIDFQVPYDDIVDYVANRVGKSEGLEISKAGVVTAYSGTDSCVLVPEYTVIDNSDGTKAVVKVSGISSTAFSGKEIEGIILSDYISEIPNNAFENCSLLKNVSAVGITKIGSNAFKGCASIGEIIIGKNVTTLGTNVVDSNTKLGVVAANSKVAIAAAQSDAKEITIAISDDCAELNNTILSVSENCEFFAFYGYGKTFNDLQIISDAKKTIINRANFDCNGQTPLVISSNDVELHEVSVTSPGICLALTADSTNLALRGESTLKATSGNSMLCKEISLSQIDATLTTSLTVDGNLLICTSKDSIIAGENLLSVTGEIIGITADEFNNYLKGVFTAKFDANGGTVSETNRTVVYGSTLGSLPTPTRDYYTFVGWFTAADGGEKVTADTVFASTEDLTYYAHWQQNDVIGWVKSSEMPAGAQVVGTKYSYTQRSYTSSGSSSMSGWIKYDTQRTSWGSTQGPVYSNPSNGSRNVWSEEYVASQTTHYVYYHRYKSSAWSDDAHASSWARHSGPDVTSPLPNGYYSSTTGQRYAGAACGSCGATNQWHLDYTYTTDNKATRWYYQDPVYTYYYYKDENKESSSNPSGSNISNVQEWVQYRVK